MTSQSRRAAADDTLEGTLYVSGNVPFTRLTLALDGKKSIILDIDSVRMKELWKMQGQRIRVTGQIVNGPMKKEVKVKEYKKLEE